MDGSAEFCRQSGRVVEMSLTIEDQKHGKHFTKRIPGEMVGFDVERRDGVGRSVEREASHRSEAEARTSGSKPWRSKKVTRPERGPRPEPFPAMPGRVPDILPASMTIEKDLSDLVEAGYFRKRPASLPDEGELRPQRR